MGEKRGDRVRRVYFFVSFSVFLSFLVSVLFVYATYNIMYTHFKMADECIKGKKNQRIISP